MRLHRAGFRVVMTDIARPTAVRRTVAFCQCMYDGTAQVEGIAARRVETAEEAAACLTAGEVPVLADPEARIRSELPFDALVDAILAKRNLGTALTDAPIVLALGPGFTAGVDCHGVVETKRGHYLGRLILAGSAIPNTGVPGDIGGYTSERIIRAPADGPFAPAARIGPVSYTHLFLHHPFVPWLFQPGEQVLFHLMVAPDSILPKGSERGVPLGECQMVRCV